MAKTCPTCGKTFDDKKAFCPDDMSTLVLSGDDTLVGTIIADRYLITDKIGEGGMGRVYRAQHVLLEKRQAAIKVLHPSLLHDSDSLTRFKREASNSSSINNPHVAQVYDFGEAGEGLVYLAIEFVPGETLSKLIAREGPLDARRVAMLVGQIADGLDAAHKLGIVHRDLKPDNILVVKQSDGEECVKVVDFGIAKAIEGEGQRVTKTGFVTGTLEYMSPEQITGSDVDARSDVYALALVACEMLTKALPFPAARAEQSMMMRLTEEPRRLKDLNPAVDVPDEVQQALDTALSRDREQRYTSAGGFAHALGLAVGGVESLPRTVVRGSDRSAPPRAPSSATLPPTAVGSAPAAAPSSGRRGPLIGGIAALLVIGVGGALWMRGRGAPAVPPPAKDSVTGPTPTSPPVAMSTSTPAPKDTVQPTVTPATTPATTPTASTPATPLGRPLSPGSTPPPVDSHPAPPLPASFAAEIGRLEKALEPATASAARSTLKSLDALLPKLRTLDDSVHTQLLRAESFMLLEQADRACRVLNSIAPVAQDPYKKQVDFYRSEVKC